MPGVSRVASPKTIVNYLDELPLYAPQSLPLPMEVFQLIFTYLPVSTIASLALSCKSIKQICDKGSLWNIFLRRDGVIKSEKLVESPKEVYKTHLASMGYRRGFYIEQKFKIFSFGESSEDFISIGNDHILVRITSDKFELIKVEDTGLSSKGKTLSFVDNALIGPSSLCLIDSLTFAAGSKNGGIAVWRLDKCIEEENLPHAVCQAYSDPVSALTFLSENRLVSISSKGSIKTWDISEGALLCKCTFDYLHHYSPFIPHCLIAKDESTLLCGGTCSDPKYAHSQFPSLFEINLETKSWTPLGFDFTDSDGFPYLNISKLMLFSEDRLLVQGGVGNSLFLCDLLSSKVLYVWRHDIQGILDDFVPVGPEQIMVGRIPFEKGNNQVFLFNFSPLNNTLSRIYFQEFNYDSKPYDTKICPLSPGRVLLLRGEKGSILNFASSTSEVIKYMAKRLCKSRNGGSFENNITCFARLSIVEQEAIEKQL